jgi:N-methylhydantoinase A
MIRIGIDIGGTFTDFAIWRGGAEGYTAIGSFKLPSSPPHFDRAVREGLEVLLGGVEVTAGEPLIVVHGTTVSTNTVIERSGPQLAFLTTKGFRDLLGLQRLRLDKPVDMFNRRAEALIPRELVYEIDERILSNGAVERRLDPEEAVAAARAAEEAGAVGIAICFLHSFRNPAHERAAVEAIKAAGIGLDVIASSEVWPQQAEYERAIVTILNAYVKQAIGGYLAQIEDDLKRRVPGSRLFITKSNGGVMAAAHAREFPVHTLLSGPAAGVTAAQYLGQMLETPHLLTMDMGGTSTDLSLIYGGQPTVSTQAEVGDFPLMMPVTGIEAIGAGGGSIAAMNGPVLSVGPRSAGATPGPACYGQGGELPTLTDAYLLSGYLNPENFLGGRLKLRPDLAEAAMQPIAAALGVDTTAAAEHCITVGTSNMVASVLPYLARLGIDPRELTLVLYGGAGALHGPLLASEIGIERVLVPRTPSIFCAFGGLVSELMHDAVHSVQGQAMTAALLEERFHALQVDVQAWLDEQVDASWLTRVRLQRFAEMRYRGQSFQVDVPLGEEAGGTPDIGHVIEAFHREHERLYNHADRQAEVEFIALRVRIAGAMQLPDSRPLPARGEGAASALAGERRARFEGRWHESCPVYWRERLGRGDSFSGPAIVEQADATVLVPPGFAASVGTYGDLLLERE